jgi:hypothetical protein
VADSVETIGTSLMAVETRPDPAAANRYRPAAPIVTQLFAMKLDLPQTRIRRRASAEEGATAYGATRTVLRTARRLPGMSWPA